jgi:uncharacterized delta-60 repeat protein
MKKKILSGFLFLSILTFSQTKGDLDPDFTFTVYGSVVRNIIVQNDGKILINGFINHSPSDKKNLFRLNPNGQLDTSFNLQSLFDFIGDVYSTAIQNDGKIIFGEKVVTSGTAKRFYRLNANGDLDTTFNNGTGFNDTPYCIKIQNDGKILVGGDFTTYNGTTSNRLIRLNNDGTIDTSFNITNGFNGTVKTIEVQSDGKILVGGDFTTFNSSAKRGLVRLNSNGTVDNNFFIGVGPNNNVNVISIQTDGKILIGGLFSTFNNTSYKNLVRLLSGGSIDNSFNIGSGFHNQPTNNTGDVASRVNSIKTLGNNILIGGLFTSVNNIAKANFVSLNSDGTIDSNFNIGTGFLGDFGDDANYTKPQIFALAVQTDAKIIATGNYKKYNGITKSYVARLLGNSILGVSDFEKQNVLIYPNPSSDYIFVKNTDATNYEIFDFTGKKVISGKIQEKINIINLENGEYLLKIIGENQKYTQKIIKK